MSPPPIDHDDDCAEKPNLTPLIDIVFLLLVFLILTTRFIEEEKFIGQLLPTDQGPSAEPVDEIVLKENLNIAIVPGDAVKGSSAADLNDLAASRAPWAIPSVRVIIDGEDLLLDTSGDQERNMERVHAFISAALARRELAHVPRGDQDPIILHCYSGLPYRYALTAYDAIRSYEQELDAGDMEFDKEIGLKMERRVSFAPPRLRDYRQHERGYELQELLALR